MEVETVTNREGFFTLELPVKSPDGGALWHEVELELVRDPQIRATAHVMVPGPEAQFGVISDIDDTVIQSNVTSKLKMLLTVALSNARTRKPFEGAAALYRALHRGINPFFYVSKSPWNLYAPLLEYFEIQGLPQGPLLLRDFSLRMKKHHKEACIDRILATYPALRFILIGDSGEQDPEIYSAVLRRHPDRVRVIYIRSVDPRPARLAAIEKLAAAAARTGCQLVLARDSEAAATHAAAEGLIPTSVLREVRAEFWE